MEKNEGGRPSKTGNSVLPVSLDDLGISKMQSSRWQKEASVAKYAAELERIRKQANKGGRPSKEKPVQIIVEVKPQERQTDHKIAEALAMFREAMKEQGNHLPKSKEHKSNNVTVMPEGDNVTTGNSRAYSIDRVKRECNANATNGKVLLI